MPGAALRRWSRSTKSPLTKGPVIAVTPPPSQNPAALLADLVDYRALVDALGPRREAFLAMVDAQVRADLRAASWKSVMSLQTTRDGEVVRDLPLRRVGDVVNEDYLRALFAFLRRKPLDGCEVDSQATQIVLGAVEKATAAFYSDSETQAALTAALARQLRGDAALGRVLHGELKADAAWLRRELADLHEDLPTRALAADFATDQVTAFLHSAAGQQLAALAGQVMASGAGTVIAHQLSIAVTKAVATGALQKATVVTIQKVGVATLTKSAAGKVALASLGIVLTPAFEVIVFAGIIWWAAHRFTKMPERLADQMPGKLRPVLDSTYDEMQAGVLRPLVEGFLASMADEAVTLAAQHQRDKLGLAA